MERSILPSCKLYRLCIRSITFLSQFTLTAFVHRTSGILRLLCGATEHCLCTDVQNNNTDSEAYIILPVNLKRYDWDLVHPERVPNDSYLFSKGHGLPNTGTGSNQ